MITGSSLPKLARLIHKLADWPDTNIPADVDCLSRRWDSAACRNQGSKPWG
jgi:hypothetical protein